MSEKWLPPPIQNLWARIHPHRQILNKAGIMVGARVVGMSLGALGSIWAARCLGPRNLGLSGMVLGIVTQAALVFGLINPTVLIREYKKNPATKKRHRLIRAASTYFFLCAAFLVLAACPLLGFHLFPRDYDFAGWFFIPLLLLTTLQPIWIFQAAEKQHFQSLLSILQPLLTALLYLAFFRPGMSAGSDLAVTSVVLLVLTSSYWVAVYRLTHFRGFPFSLKDLGQVWSLMRQSKWFFIANLSLYAYTVLEQPLLGWLHSVEELGLYRSAVTISNSAQNLFYIIPNVLFPRFLDWRSRGEHLLWRRQIKLAKIFGAVSVLGILGTALVLPVIYPWLFGVAYTKAALPCVILIASKFVVMTSGVFVWGLRTDPEYDRSVSIYLISTAVLSVLLNLIFIPRFGMYAAAITALVSQVFLCVGLVWVSWRRARRVLWGKGRPA